MKEKDERINVILNVLLSYVRKDFSQTIPISNKKDELDSLAMGLNAMAEELQSYVTQLEAVNEEVQASNEELASTNEELMVLNERLEEATRTIAQQKDEQLNRVLDSSNDVIWSFDLTGNGENYLSRSAERIYGEPLDVLIQKPRFWLEHLHPEDLEIKKESQRRLQEQGFTECTYRILLPDGVRWIHDRLRLLRNSNGDALRLEGIATDVTTIKGAEEELDREHRLLRSLIDNIPDYIFVKDEKLRHVINNRANVELLGAVNEKETLGKTAEDYFGDQGSEFVADDLSVFTTGRPILNKEETINSGDQQLTLLTTKVPVKDATGKVVNLIGISRDITEYRKQENILTQYRQNLDIIFSNSSETFLLLEASGKVIMFNAAFHKFIFEVAGIEAQVGMNFLEVVTPNRKELAQSMFERALKGEKISAEAELLTKDGKKIYHFLRYEPRLSNGGVTHVSISGLDVTSRKEKESLLEESEANLQGLLNSTLDGFILLNSEGTVISANESYRAMAREATGIEVKPGMSLFEIIPQPRHEFFRSVLAKVRSNEVVQYQSHYEQIGSWYDVTITPVMTSQGLFVGYCLGSRNITSQKEAENVIKASEEHYRAVVENSLDVSSIVDFNGNVLFTSANLPKILGYENLDSGYGEIIHPEDISIFEKGLSFLVDNPGKSFTSTMRIRHKDGSWRWLEGISTDLRHLKSIGGVVSTHHDVTARRAMEDDIKRAALTLSEFQKAIYRSSIVSIADRKGDITFVNDNFIKISGYSQEELVGKNHRIVNSGYHQKSFWVSMWKTISAGEIWRNEVKNKAKDGSFYWVDTFVMPFVGEDGQVREYLSIRNDITERKKNEEKIVSLNISLADFQQAINGSSIVSMADRKGTITFVNENFAKISGFSERELIGQNHRIVNSGHHPSSFWVDMWKTIAAGRTWRREVMNKAKDGSYYWVDTFIMPFLNEDGTIREFLSIRNDITERKKNEEELLRNQFFLEKASESAKIGYWTSEPTGPDGQLTWSKEVFKMLQMDEKKFDGRNETFFNFIHPEDRDTVVESSLLATRGGHAYNIDHRIVLQNGEIIWVNERAQIIKNADYKATLMVGIVQDITERKATEARLKESIGRYEILSIATNDVIWDWDIIGDTVLYNHAMQMVLGYSDQELKSTGTWWKDRFHPEDHDRVLQEIREIFDKQLLTWDSVYRYRTADGNYKYMHDRAYVVYDAIGRKPIRMIGAMQDVTEQTVSLEEIKKLSLVASKTDNAVIITDSKGKIEWVNDGFTKLTGYDIIEAKWKSPYDLLVGPATDKAVVQRIIKKLERLELVTEELTQYDKRGNTFWVKISISPVLDTEGKPGNFVMLLSDISDQKEYERSITSIAHELASLIENANVPIFGVDRNGKISDWNRVCAELTGYSKTEAQGTHLVGNMVSPEKRELFNEMIAQVMNGSPVSNLEIPIISKSQDKIILLMSASPSRDLKNTIQGVTIVAQNITELSEYRIGLENKVAKRTQELHQALQKEKELVEMKSKFVSIASHEFRTPLSSISLVSGFIRKYKQKMTPEEMDKKLQNIEEQVHHMSYLLDDVLTIGKSEAGRLKVNLSSFNCRRLFENLTQEVSQSTHGSHRINLKIDTEKEFVQTDEKLMRNIVINLLTNSIKFSPEENKVDMTVSCRNKTMQIRVRDFGIGILPEDYDKLFESFSRGGNVTAFPGTGLGLSIVKKAVELLGGEVSLTSEVNKGTEFIVNLPLRNEK